MVLLKKNHEESHKFQYDLIEYVLLQFEHNVDQESLQILLKTFVGQVSLIYLVSFAKEQQSMKSLFHHLIKLP